MPAKQPLCSTFRNLSRRCALAYFEETKGLSFRSRGAPGGTQSVAKKIHTSSRATKSAPRVHYLHAKQ
jgi:hypothetical protein